MKKFGTPSGAGPGSANEKVGLDGVGTPFAVNGGGGDSGFDGDPPPRPWLGLPGEVPFALGRGACERTRPFPVRTVPVGCCEGWDPLGVGLDEPDVPVVGCGVGALELLDVLEVGGDGVLTDGVLTDGVLTDGVLTDGTLTDGTLTDGSGDDEESAGGTAIAVIAPNRPAATDATNNFLRLDTGGISYRVRSSLTRRHNMDGC